ncbi:MAG: Gfo/Idh/MocA family oxidoreductase [Chloroflexota bacterium]|nr:Gfo/Idh/MocA family oxidoreductase [Chloroflexota bacterium]
MAPDRQSSGAPVRFGVIGVNHNHIHGMTDLLVGAGAELVTCFAAEPELAADFVRRYPQARLARSADEVLEDTSISLIATAAIPSERAGIGMAAMRYGKDFLSDKPGFTSLDQLADARRVQRETSRIYSVCYSERFQNPATVRAGELVAAGAIGRPLQTIGLGPHRLQAPTRPAWFFEHARYGGILCDIASHQADQFLFFTGSTSAEIVASQVANFAHPEYPELEDFGDMLVRGDGGSGYIRVDWFTPDGLNSWGDGRLTILGTKGFIEVRKNTDLAGRAGGSHLFVVDVQQTRYIDCREVSLPFGRQLLDDIRYRTQTAMPQAHAFLASELALRAQLQASRLSAQAPRPDAT